RCCNQFHFSTPLTRLTLTKAARCHP
ncbi:uncharacterized protein METZ01_LOCUS283924, partial [marine metagenome]